MANITFSSPALKKDVTVYAVAGDRRTLLALAQEHNIPIHFECQYIVRDEDVLVAF